MVFTPDAPLDWSTQYTLRIDAGLQDQFGNPTPDTTQVLFTVQSQPPLEVTGASPPEVAAGNTLVISGTGFDNGDPTQNNVIFTGASPVQAFASTLEELFVTVPTAAQSGSLQVFVGASASNWFPITIVEPKGIPVGTPLGTASLGANPKRIEIGPMGEYAYVSTDAGVTAVNSDPSDTNFLTDIVSIPLAGGSNGVVAMPDGKRVLVISSSPPELNVIDAEPGSPFQNQVDATARVSLDAEPLGIAVVPGGSHVVIAYADRVVRHVASVGPDFGGEVQQWNETDIQFLGYIAVSADAGEVYATRSDGKVGVMSFNPAEGTDGNVAALASGTDPRAVAGTPGLRMLSVDQSATIREFDSRGPQLDSHGESGGYEGLSVSPEGTYAYAANLILNKIDVFDISSSVNLATTIPTGVDPQDVTTGFGGRYVYAVTNGPDQLEVFDTEVGPVVETVNPASGGDGTLLTIIGSGFDPSLSTAMVGGIPVTPTVVSADSTSMVVPQPSGADDSGIMVMVGTQNSNTKPYKVVNRPDQGVFSFAAVADNAVPSQINEAFMSPTEEYLVTTYTDGFVSVLIGEPQDPRFLISLQDISAVNSGLPPLARPGEAHHRAWAPDGRKLYSEGLGNRLNAWSVAPRGGTTPVSFLGEVQDGGAALVIDVDNLVMAPDGKRLFALDVVAAGTSYVYEVHT
jgi:hypothetical protein